MPKGQFDIDVANGVAIDFANDVLLICWIEVYPFRFNQSKSLLHVIINYNNVKSNVINNAIAK